MSKGQRAVFWATFALSLILFGTANRALAQDEWYLQGRVYDAITSAPIQGATVALPGTVSCVSGPDGTYSLGPLDFSATVWCGLWYELEADAPGYLSLFKWEDPSEVGIGMDWPLVPRGTSPPPRYWRSTPHDYPVSFANAIAGALDGTVYLLSPNSFRDGPWGPDYPGIVRAYSPQGTLLAQWHVGGWFGPADNAGEVGDIAVAPDGTVLVTSPASRLWQRFTPQGELLQEIQFPADRTPGQIAVDGNTVYLALSDDIDHGDGNSRDRSWIAAYTLDGTLLRQWTTPAWGGYYADRWAEDLAVAPDHSVWARFVSTMVKYSPGGEILDEWVWGEPDNDALVCLDIGSDGLLYMIPRAQDGIYILSPEGALLEHRFLPGRAPGERGPTAVARYGLGQMAHYDYWSLDVVVTTLDGSLVREWGGHAGDAEESFASASSTYIRLAAAPDGTVWVTDPGNSRVKHYSPTGALLGSFRGAEGLPFSASSPGPMDIAVVPVPGSTDPAAYRVCVQDAVGRLQVYTPAGEFERVFPHTFPEWGRLAGDTEGYLWAVEPAAHVTRFALDGTEVESWDLSADGVADALAVSPDGEVFVYARGTGSRLTVRRYDRQRRLLGEYSFQDSLYPPAGCGWEFWIEDLKVAPDLSQYVLLGAVDRNYLLHLSRDGVVQDARGFDSDPIIVPPWAGGFAISPTGPIWIADPENSRLLSVYYGTFYDVPPWHWAVTGVEAVAAANIVHGYGDDSYRPGLEVTRDQMAVYIARAMAGGDANVPDGPAAATFSDVPCTGCGASGTDPYWAYKYVEYVAAQRIVGGYAPGVYAPLVSVDRAQMAVFMARTLAPFDQRPDLPDYTPPATPAFPDVLPDYWAYKEVEYIRAYGVVSGYPDGHYHPEYICTRDQLAMYVARAFGLMP